MTDSHAHLSFEQITSNLIRVMDEFVDNGGLHLLNVGYTPESNATVLTQHLELSSRYPGVVQTAIGIHPEYTLEVLSEGMTKFKQLDKTLDALEDQVSTHRSIISAVGECGLDYYQLKLRPEITANMREELMEQQRHIFRRQVEIAIKYKLPISIHTRDEQGSNQCVGDTLKIISDVGKGSAKGSFHSYTQDEHFIPQILSLGFHIGVNGIATYPKAENVRAMLRFIPLDRMLLETDSPLLPPQGVRKNRKFWRSFGGPVDVGEIAGIIAETTDSDKEAVLKATTENYKQLFLVD